MIELLLIFAIPENSKHFFYKIVPPFSINFGPDYFLLYVWFFSFSDRVKMWVMSWQLPIVSIFSCLFACYCRKNPSVQDGWAVIMHKNRPRRSRFTPGRKMTHYTYCMTAIYYHRFFCALERTAQHVTFFFMLWKRVDIQTGP